MALRDSEIEVPIINTNLERKKRNRKSENDIYYIMKLTSRTEKL